MIILHLHFQQGEFYLWGEARQVDPFSEAVFDEVPTPHPFAASVESLRSALQRESRDPAVDMLGEMASTLTLRLPSANRKPVPSDPLLRMEGEDWEPPAKAEAFIWESWEAPALKLSFPVLRFLLTHNAHDTHAAANPALFSSGVLRGTDLLFWVRFFGFSQALVIGEHFYPYFDFESKTATWRGMLQAPHQALFQTFVETMPVVCLETEGDSDSTGAISQTLMHALDVLADRQIREALFQTTFRESAPPEGSLHDRWLITLQRKDGTLPILNHEAKQLRKEMRLWHTVLKSTTAPYRLCFRLEEPVLEEAERNPESQPQTAAERKAVLQATAQPWTLRYLIQSIHDPSLVVAVETLWQGRNETLEKLRRLMPETNLQEHILLSFGQAMGLYPPIEGSLQSPSPWGVVLETEQASHFLSEAALCLEQAGFGVFLPAWWNPHNKRQRLAMFAQVKSAQRQSPFESINKLGLNEILTFDWQASLGDQALTRQELEWLAKSKTSMVRLRNQWVMVDPGSIQAMLKFWAKNDTGRASVRDLLKMSLGFSPERLPVDFAGVQATGWMSDLLEKFHENTGFEEMPAPRTFLGTLRPYQARGYSWMAFLRQWGLGACLADDMGLGKTVQTLALLQSEWENAHPRKPTLLVCPTSVLHNWYKEAQKFTPDLPVYVHHGPERLKGKAFGKEVKRQGLVVSSYALLHRDAKLLNAVDWAGMILDEAQNIKNVETRQSQAARALRAEYRIALTGTPVENNVGDLWSIMEFLNPGFLGSHTAFKENFFIPIQMYRDEEAADRLKALTKPFILRRLKTDKSIIQDLPKKQETTTYCTLTPEQVSLYQAVVKDMEEKLETATGIERRGLILAALIKLKQVCNHPAQFLGDPAGVSQPSSARRSGKLVRLTEMLDEILANGERTLLFTQFSGMGTILQQYLQETFGREVLFLHGGVTKDRRDRMVERFQNGDERHAPPIFILSLKAGGTGLTLTQANHVFHFDRWWNPAVENQATDRAFRIGQTRAVQVYKFVCTGTLEEKIDAIIQGKSELAEQIVGSSEGWLTELSTGDLKDLLSLSRDTLQESLEGTAMGTMR